MPSQSSRVAGLVAAGLALALTISAAVVIHAFAQSTQSQETTGPSPPVKVKVKGETAKGEPVHSMAGMDHSAMDHGKGDPNKGKYTTIVGEVMDPACFLEAGSKSIGPGHYQCAYDCARSGQTLAIYARDEDRIYFIAGELPGKNPNEPLLPYVHKKVDVSGTVYHRSDAWGIVITKVALHDDKAGGKASAPAGAPGGK
jgi:hypothetical protein